MIAMNFVNRSARNSLMPEEVARIPWPLYQQYEMIHHWMDKQDPLSALLQLRDTSETLIKLLATLFLAYDLRKAQNGEELDKDCPIFNLVRKPLTLGVWCEIFLAYTKQRNNPMVETFFSTLSMPENQRYWSNNPLLYFVKQRNQLGHGILALDMWQYYETVQEWLEKLDECLRNLLPFFSKITIFSQAPVEPALSWTAANFPLIQSAPQYPFHLPENTNFADIYPVYVKLQEDTLSLAPVLTIQSCEKQECSIFFLHEYKESKQPARQAKARFLEFLVKGTQVNKESPLLQKLSEQSLAQQSIQELNLDNMTAVEYENRNIPVDYLIQQVKTYIDSHEKGLMLLKGPGGVGKTWFCKNLGQEVRSVESIYIPLQKNVDLKTLLVSIENECRTKKWGFSASDVNLQDAYLFIPAIFNKLKENCPRKKFILVLDGLDELPDHCEILDYLGCSLPDLPMGSFILIAHRPALKAKAHALVCNMSADQQYSIVLEMNPENMQEAIRKFIATQNFSPSWTEPILKKAHGIFLYAYHYCFLLGLKLINSQNLPIDSQNLPDEKDIYPGFFDELQQRVGMELFQAYYIPLLCSLAVAKQPATLDQLIAWGIPKSKVLMILKDIAPLLERDTSKPNILYSIRHQDIFDFFQEQEHWRKKCQEQEEKILVWAKNKLQEILRNSENDLNEQEQYAIIHTISHWNTIAQRDVTTAQKLFPLEELEAAILQCIQQLGEEFPDVGKAYDELSGSHQQRNQEDKALEYAQKALEIRLAKLGSDHPDVAMTYHNMAGVYQNQGEYDKALEYYRKALEIRLLTLGIDHPDIATTYHNMAGVYQGQGQYDKALEYYQKALEIRLLTLGSDHADVAMTYYNMAGVYHKMAAESDSQEQYEKNQQHYAQYYNKALAILERQLSQLRNDHPDVATVHRNMAAVYTSQSQYEKALGSLTKAKQILLSRLGGDHPNIATIYRELAAVYAHDSQYNKAMETYNNALTILLLKLGKEHLDVAMIYHNMAILYTRQKQYEKAIEGYQQALTIIQKLRINHPDVAMIYSNIAFTYYQQKNYDKAMKYGTQAIKIFKLQLGPQHPYTQNCQILLNQCRYEML